MNQVHFWLLVYFMQILVLLLSESIKGPYTVRCFYATVRNWVSQLSAPYVIITFRTKRGMPYGQVNVHVMVMLVGGVELQLHSFSTSSVDGYERR